MGYQDQWNEITSDPDWANVPEAKKQDLARFFARKFVRPEVGSSSQQMRDFLQANVVKAAPVAPRPELPFGLGPVPTAHDVAADIKQNALSNAKNLAREAVRAAVDTNPVANVRRASQKATDAIFDNTVGKALHLPTSEQARRNVGLPANGRVLAPNVASQESIPGHAGAMIGSLADPLYALNPLGNVGKAAPTLARGVNLLPRVAPKAPSVLGSGLAEALRTGVGFGAVAGANSLASDLNDNQSLDLNKAALDAALSGGMGGALGGLSGALHAVQAGKAIARTDAAARARVASIGDNIPTARDPHVTDERMGLFQLARQQLAERQYAEEMAARNKARQDLRAIANQMRQAESNVSAQGLEGVGPADTLVNRAPEVTAQAGPAPRAMSGGNARDPFPAEPPTTWPATTPDAAVQAHLDQLGLGDGATPRQVGNPLMDVTPPRAARADITNTPDLTPVTIKTTETPKPAAQMTMDEARAALAALDEAQSNAQYAARFKSTNLANAIPAELYDRANQAREVLGQAHWQRTQAQVKGALRMPAEAHRKIVARALEEGKPVPPEVLADYPDLTPVTIKAAEPGAPKQGPSKLHAWADHLEAKGQAILDDTRGRLHTGIDVDHLAGHALILLSKMLRHVARTGQRWTPEMSNAWAHEIESQYGPEARPALWSIFDEAEHLADPENIPDPIDRHLNRYGHNPFEPARAEVQAMKDAQRAREEAARAEQARHADELRRAQSGDPEAFKAVRERWAAEEAPAHDGAPFAYLGSNYERARLVTSKPSRIDPLVRDGALRKATPEAQAARAADREYLRRLEVRDTDPGLIEEGVRHQGRDLTLTNKPTPRPDLSEPRGSSFKRLLQDESGAVDLGAVGDAARAAASGALRGAEAVGAGARRATGLYVDLIDRAMQRTGLKGAAAKLEEWRQIIKTHPTDSELVEGFRRQFISNYGVPPEVLRLADEASRQAHREALPLRRQALDLVSRLNAQQQHDIEQAVTEPQLRQALTVKLARETGLDRLEVERMIRSITDESTRMSNLLKDVGAVTPDGVARWEGQYLPRAYEDKFPVVSALVKKASASLKGKKGRGITEHVRPGQVAEYQAQGWEYRGEVGGKAVMWRDYTLSERQKMGQEFHASAAMGRMANEFERDFRSGRLLSDIAKGSDEHGDFALPIPKKVKGQPAPAVPDGYVLWDDINAEVPGTGIQKWGDLAGHYVRQDVARYLRWSIEDKLFWDKLKTATGVNLWKKFKTLYNPSYFVNNAMQNVPALELAGGSVGDLPGALREIVDQGALYRQLEEFGTVKNGAIARDLGIELEALGTGNGTPMDLLVNLSRAAKKLDAGLAGVSGATDDLFRLALVQSKLREGLAFEDAARFAEQAFYNSENVTAPMAQRMEALGVPFAKVGFYMLDKLPELTLTNPAKALALVTYFNATKGLIDAWNGTTARQKAARDVLVPDHLKGAGNYMPTPFRDTKGNALLLNTANWNPGGFMENAEQAKLPYFPRALMPGGPAVTGLEALINYDPFYGKPLRTDTEDRTGEFLWNNLGPSGPFAKLGTLKDAIQGRESYNGLRYDVPTALANVAGVKLQPYTPDLAMGKLAREFKGNEAEIKSRIRYLATMAANNPQDAASYQKQIDQLVQQLQQSAERFGQKMNTAAGAF